MLSLSRTMDSTIEQTLVAQLAAHGLLKISDLGVEIRAGVAHIEGRVPNLKQKWLAGEIAGQIEGLEGVVNKLRIVPLTAVRDDGIKKHIARGLLRNPTVDDRGLSIEVRNGVVRLSGLVRTAAEKRLIEDEAWSAPGVKDIASELEITSAGAKSEVQIAGEILQGLSHCLGLDLSKVTVAVDGCVACLRGTVPNDYLRSAAEELARWTPPVTEVVNELEVGPGSWVGRNPSEAPVQPAWGSLQSGAA